MSPTDHQIASGGSGGGDWARSSEFEDLFREQFGPIATFATFVCGRTDLGEELAQEAFARLVFRANGRPDDPRAYLRATVVNCWRSALRRARIEVSTKLRRTRPMQQVEPQVLDVVKALQRLPLMQRSCVVLRFLEDRSEEEVANMLGISPNTVKTHVRRGLERLRLRMGGSDDE